MPVKWLQTFCENTPGILLNGNLKELIKQELSNTGDRPNIVIDGSSIPYFFNPEELKCNLRQPAVTKIKIESFFEQIISYGANVIVVLRGNTDRSPHYWFLKARNKLLQEGKKCNTPEEICYNFVSAIIFCSNETMATISNEHYTVFTSTTESVKEVAEIAVKKKCLAVLGEDSNYLIYEGIRFYILLKSIDIETFNCKFHDRNELLKCLGLKSFQLPMFATLCGNDVLSFYSLRNFHKRISLGKLFSTVLNIADEVKHFPNLPYHCIKEMVYLIGNKCVTENEVKKSLDMYLKFEQIQPNNEMIKFVLERIRKCDWSQRLHSIFVHGETYFKRLTGICDTGLTSYELLRPLRKKLYGILLPSDVPSVKEYFLEEMLAHSYKTATPKTVFKISTLENPGLIELFRNRTPEMNFLRWELFLRSVSETLSFSDIRIVPENYLFPVMALHYMHVTVRSYFERKKIFKQEFEMEAFLLGVLLFKEFPRERLEKTEDSKPGLWELQLNTLYLDVCFTLFLLNQVCGFVIPRQKACICSYYDEKLTHWIYNKMKRGATCDEFFENDTVLEALFYTFMDIIKTE